MANLTAIPSQGKKNVSLKGKVLFFQNGLPPSFPPGLRGSATSSSAKLGYTSSGKSAGVWIHFLVVQTDAVSRWAGMETPVTYSSEQVERPKPFVLPQIPGSME